MNILSKGFRHALLLLPLLTTAMDALGQPQSRPSLRSWDFSASHEIQQVPWPEGKGNFLDSLFVMDVQGDVCIKVTAEKSFEGYVEAATFLRDGKQLSFVEVRLEPQTLKNTFDTASNLCDKWNLPRPKPEAWKKAVDSGRDEVVLLSNPQAMPFVSAEIVRTFDKNKPFRISFTIGWDDQGRKR